MTLPHLPNLPAPDSREITEQFQRLDRLTSRVIPGDQGQLWFDPGDPYGVRSLIMSWAGQWQSGKTYYPGQIVLDDGWVMTPNKPTSDRPAPQPTGLPSWVSGYSDPPVELALQTSALGQNIGRGQRYTFTVGGYVLAARAYNIVADPDVEIAMYSMVNPESANPSFNEVARWNSEVVEWVELPIGQNIVYAGTVLDVWVDIANHGAGYVEDTYNYNYITPTQEGAPVPGQISHSDRLLNEFRVNYTDADGGDQSAFLGAITPGDTVTDGNVTWNINQVTDMGTWVIFGVTPQAQTADGLGAFTFRHYTPATVPYGRALDWYVSNPNIQGRSRGADGVWDLNEHGYQVDLQVQAAAVSPDWDVVHEATG